MSLKSTYRKITGIATLMVMIWNIVGWLGFGLILNHAHTHEAGNYCEITFCSCEIDEGETICTCHHNNGTASNEDHHNESTHSEFCYYDVPHNSNSDTTQALIFSAKINALCHYEATIAFPKELKSAFVSISEKAHSGITADLLRPPRV